MGNSQIVYVTSEKYSYCILQSLSIACERIPKSAVN